MLKNSMLIYFFGISVMASGTAAQGLKRTVFKVDQMTCGACAAKVYNRLIKLEGFKGLLVNIDKQMIAVDHWETLAPETIIAAMAGIGKPARRLPVSETGSTKGISGTTPGWRQQSDSLLARIFRMFKP